MLILCGNYGLWLAWILLFKKFQLNLVCLLQLHMQVVIEYLIYQVFLF
uniref:Uncharacterized protein n=1 Tax=Anguilla anguilla TaxID=7936 RepID=A0A0E9TFW9_ANGAN